MSDLSTRLRSAVGLTIKLGRTLDQAADALDAKDASLAEAQATVEAMQINHASLGKRALRWQERAEAAEARIATLEGAAFANTTTKGE